jgi:hypothetical protein
VGRWQVVDHRIQQELHALVLERAAAQYREYFAGHGRATYGTTHFFEGYITFLEVHLKQDVVVVGEPLYQLGARFLGSLQ